METVKAVHRQRVEDQLRRILTELIQRRVKDPRASLCTVTEVSLRDDLRSGTVYLSILGGEAAITDALDAIGRAAGFLRTEATRTMRLKHVPDLRFVHDDRLLAQERIERLLEEASGERTRGDGTPSDDDDRAT